MSLSDWGIVASIVASVLGGAVLAGRALFSRLDHLDDCIDDHRKEAAENVDKTRTELLIEATRVRDALIRHAEREEPRLGHIEQTLAWIAGRMGNQEP